MEVSVQETRFVWNAGGWFGSQFGCTIWMLVLGVATAPIDVLSGVVALAGFALGNLWGLALWRRRDHVAAYSGLQWMLAGLVLVFAAVVVTTNARVPSVFLPYWVIACPLPLMGLFWLLRHHGGPNKA